MNKNLIDRKQKLKETELKEKIGDSYFKNCQKIDQGIKKIAEKQILINNLMSFYFTRRVKASQDLREQMENERNKPKGGKGRIDDNRQIAMLYERILNKS